MPGYLKVIIYVAVLLLLGLASKSIPRSEKEFHFLLGLVDVAWIVGGLFFGARGLYRFITR